MAGERGTGGGGGGYIRAAPAAGDRNGDALIAVINGGSRTKVVRSVLCGNDLQLIHARRQSWHGDRSPSRVQLPDREANTRRVIVTGRGSDGAPGASRVSGCDIETTSIYHKIVAGRASHLGSALGGESHAVLERFVVLIANDVEINVELAARRTRCGLDRQ